MEEAYDRLLDDDGHAMLLVAMANFREQSLDTVGRTDPPRRRGARPRRRRRALRNDLRRKLSRRYMLAHWTRDRPTGRLTVAEAVRELTSVPARVAGLADRGRIALGYKADLNVIDARGAAAAQAGRSSTTCPQAGGDSTRRPTATSRRSSPARSSPRTACPPTPVPAGWSAADNPRPWVRPQQYSAHAGSAASPRHHLMTP